MKLNFERTPQSVDSQDQEVVLIKNDALEEGLENEVETMFLENGFELQARQEIDITFARALRLYIDEVLGADSDELYRYRIAGVLNIVGRGELALVRKGEGANVHDEIHELKGTSAENNEATIRGRFRLPIPESLEADQALMLSVRNRMHFYRDRKEKAAFEAFLGEDAYYEGSSYDISERPEWVDPSVPRTDSMLPEIVFAPETFYPTIAFDDGTVSAHSLDEAKEALSRYINLSLHQ